MDPDTHTLLLYEYVDDIIERRGPYRDAHIALLQQLKDSGTILMAGAVGDPVSGAAIVFYPCDPAEVGEYVLRDPYVVNGLVTTWRALPWNVVV
ncbi:MAG: YciI family protein [Miltoncostaeaceae bacterium]